jgi:hypothetical protein
VYGPPEDNHFDSPVEFVLDHQQRLRQAFEFVRENLGRAANRRKQSYDMRCRPHRYDVGQWVWLFTPRRRPRLSHKWQNFYDGPYLVTKTIGSVNVEIQRGRNARPSVVHIDKLKPCHSHPFSSWLRPDVTEAAPIIPDQSPNLNTDEEDPSSANDSYSF